MYDQNGGDVVVEEDTGDATRTVRNLESQLVVLLVTLCKVPPELGRTVLVGVDNPPTEGPELSRDDFEEVLEHVVIFHGLGDNDSVQDRVTRGRDLRSIQYYPMDNQRLPSGPSGSAS